MVRKAHSLPVSYSFRHMVVPLTHALAVLEPLTSSSWLWTCWTIRSMATIFPPPERDDKREPICDDLGVLEQSLFQFQLLVSPLGTTISASLMVGSMYCSKAGFTNLLYCLITPSMSRPRSVMSLRSRRTSRMSESVSTKIFISRSCGSRQQTHPHMVSGLFTSAAQTAISIDACFKLLNDSLKREKKEINLLPYLKKLFVRKRHNSLKYDHAGTIHIFLHRARKSRECSKAVSSKVGSAF